MGRSSTGAVHHFTALRISISTLQQYTPKNGVALNQSMSWSARGTNRGSINYNVSFASNDRYLKIKI